MNLALMVLVLAIVPAPEPFAIEVVDAATGRGIPLVELTTVHGVRFWTDNAGLIAIDDVDLMGETFYFHVKSHGYEYGKDGFGYRGKALKLTPGGHERLTMTRINIAERLYRVTGGGLYRDSVALGKKPPIPQPLLNAKVLGSDSVLTAIYHGKVHWFWGDTNRPDYPLGNFHVPGATSLLPTEGGLDPAIGVDLTYWTDPATGFARPTAQLPGEGPTWLDGLIVLNDASKRERMFAFYAKIRPPLDAYERGLAEWDDAQSKFTKVVAFTANQSLNPGALPSGGHPFLHTDQGVNYIYYANPYPLTRVRADAEALKDPANFARFTCLEPHQETITRDPQGRAVYAWKQGGRHVGPVEQAALIKSGKLKPNEALIQLRDVETGKPVQAHGGSVAWNEHRKRWVMIAVEAVGSSSFLGEVWYAEADEPTGPWVYARKIATHDKYTFYNPRHHPFFDQEHGRLLYFEATYTNTFSGNTDHTPRYDYNQVMYRLDLGDSRMNLPVAIYHSDETDQLTTVDRKLPLQSRRVAFFALDRPGPDSVPIAEFHALKPDSPGASKIMIPLYEYRSQPGDRKVYTIDPAWVRSGYQRSEKPVGLVWPNPHM